MKTLFFPLFFLYCLPFLMAQRESDIWFFGQDHTGMLFHHSLEAFQSYNVHVPLNGEGCGVATDPTTGQLLFYSDGAKIYNRNHELMADNLGGDPSSAQAVAMIPVPGGCNTYYVFSNSKGGQPSAGNVYMATVDMDANGGLGGVVASNYMVRTKVYEGMLTIAKPGTKDFWLVGTDENTGSTFYVYAITSNGISLHAAFNLGPAAYTYCLSYSEKAGRIAVSYPSANAVYTFSFDALSGTLSSPKFIDNQDHAYDSEWSADGTKLYYASWQDGPNLRQYDFNTQTITPILQASNMDWRGGGLKIGPDNAIYFISEAHDSYLSRIAQPNLAGLACNYQAHYLPLESPVRGLNLPVTLTPVFSPPGCIRPHWEARVNSIDDYVEPAEPWCAVVANGQAQIPPANANAAYYWSNFKATLPREARISGEVTLECRIKNGAANGGIDAYDVNLNVGDGFKAASVNFIGTVAGTPYTGIHFGAQGSSGLPELVTDLSDWHRLSLQVTASEVKTYVDGNLRYTLPHDGALCWLSIFSISMKGSGVIDQVVLRNAAGDEIYFEDFNSATEGACLYAPPVEENYLNRYAGVQAICGNWLTVSDPTAFAPGDTVLLMQMQGAVVDTSETPACGAFLDYGNAGHYELNTVEKVQGQRVLLRNKLLRTYDVAGQVQLIYVPWLGQAATIGCYTAPAWNGITGGVLAFTGGDITLNGDLNVSGRGFGGGPYFDGLDACQPEDRNFNYPATEIDSAGTKGYGIVTPVPNRSRGKGAQGNGGGGGNAHNGGGGGSGNMGPGGNGGGYSGGGCPQNNISSAGLGGYPVQRDNTLANNRAIMGGGGGAGHANGDKGSAGGSGGGIVLIRARRLLSEGYTIHADGEDAPIHASYPANNDGGGGGGAGGSIMLQLEQGVVGHLELEAKGGNGAKVANLHGNGGGGGGGLAWVNAWPAGNTLDATLTGGFAGVSPNGNTNGATNGANGLVLTGLTIPLAYEPFAELRITDISAQPDCAGKATLKVLATGGNAGPGYALDGNAWTSTGIFTNLPAGTVHVRATDGCTAVDTLVELTTITPLLLDTLLLRPQICRQSGTLTAVVSGGALPIAYLLDGQPGSTGYFESLQAGVYPFTATDTIGCQVSAVAEIPDWSYDIPVEATDTVDFLYDTPVSLGAVLLSAGGDTVGLHWRWSPTVRLACADCQNTLAHPSENLLYTVLVSDTFGCTGTAGTFARLIGSNIFQPNVFGLKQREFYFNCDATVLNIALFQVYDRWGALVGEQKNVQPDAVLWDGQINGREAPVGVYWYTATLQVVSGSTLQLSGNVTFIGHR